MTDELRQIIDSYDANAPLDRAFTIPASWYTHPGIFELERRTVFARSWQCAARSGQLDGPRRYVTLEIGGEPLLIVRGDDEKVRAFFNVCRHHAAAVMTELEGRATHLRCPYHGWTYTLDGRLSGTPEFDRVCDFNRSDNGLVAVDIAAWEKWWFTRMDPQGASLQEFLGPDLIDQTQRLDLGQFHWFQRRRYVVECNWKVYIDNYLDGGYHVPHLHPALHGALDYKHYTIENGPRFCLQSSPVLAEANAVRSGSSALYYWLYPNFMINFYEGVMDTNLVLPLGVDRTEVIFDFFFTDVSEQARGRNEQSIGISEQIQDEDVAICRAVQRGLGSRSYTAGRLSLREAGIHLFHRLLHADFVEQSEPNSP